MTVLGSHTAHELDDLLKAKVFEIDKINAAYYKTANATNHSDPTFARWQSDWSAFLATWAGVHARAQAGVNEGHAALVGWDYYTQEDLWHEVIASLAPFQELYNRWTNLAQGSKENFDAMPQPNAPDHDLSALILSQQITKPIDQAGAAIASGAASLEKTLADNKLLIGGGMAIVLLLLLRR